MEKRRLITCRVAFFLGAVFVSLLFVPASYAQPKIFFEEVIFDAGEVEQGEEVEHVFSFLNQGLDELVIQKVSTS